MIYSVIDSYRSLIKIPKGVFEELDIYDREEIEKFVKVVIIQVLKKKKMKGFVFLDIYMDPWYGMIMEIDNKDIDLFDDQIDIKLTFHLNSSFLYEMDYFDMLEMQLNHQVVYYYDNKFYLDIINAIDTDTYLRILECCQIVYQNDSIIEKGILMNI